MSERGAVWRQWDLHVHTPASYRWSGQRLDGVEGEERTRLLDSVLERMLSVDTAAFSVMDYWTFDGYLALRRRVEERGGFPKKIFPGMEVRCEAPGDFRLNMHVLLSDELTEQQLADFKATLILVGTESRLSDEGLARLARRLTADKLRQQGIKHDRLVDDGYARDAGAKVALIKRDSLYAAVGGLPEGTGLLMAPWETYGGVEGLRLEDHPVVISEIMANADVWETRKSFFVDLFRGRETAKNKRFIEHFLATIGGRPRPSVSGSDAHRLADYGSAPTGQDGEIRRTWIKADLSFEGLRQTLNEPATRVHIGTVPPERQAVVESPTRYIDRVTVWKNPTSELPEEWFDADIPLNPYLVAIIGNKGSGKSALLDIIGLLGQSRAAEHFSFLNEERFRNRRANKASHFRGRISWRDGASQEMGLAETVGAGVVERVKYVPQSYLESVCNEIDLHAGGRFRTELESVIFSHVPGAERLGYGTLEELLNHKVRETDDRIRNLRGELAAINLRIEHLEEQTLPERRAELGGTVEEIARALAAIDAQKPEEIAKPDADGEDERARLLREAVERADADVAALAKVVERVRGDVAAQNRTLDAARQARELLGNLKHQVDSYSSRLAEPLARLGVTLDEVVTFAVDEAPVGTIAAASRVALVVAQRDLDPKEPASSAARLATAQRAAADARANLEGPQRSYNEYLAKLAAWQGRRNSVLGDEATDGTLLHARARLAALDAVPAALDAARTERTEKVREVYAELSALKSTYEALYAPVQAFAHEHALLAERFKPEFSVRLETSSFSGDFLRKVARNRAGSFYGENGEREVELLVESADFESAEGAVAFVDAVLDRLSFDRREGQGGAARRVADQLRSDVSPHEVYDFVCGLSYLSPEYRLELHGKSLAELSPGERGTLLLMFYLLVDQSRIPLLIDQPEENLDNQTVFSLVGQCIREAKKRRQVIIVTHNPNLAVACDAEQVICAARESDGSNRVRYVSGSIENPAINAAILEILEGTQPAFDNRESKYLRSLPE